MPVCAIPCIKWKLLGSRQDEERFSLRLDGRRFAAAVMQVSRKVPSQR